MGKADREELESLVAALTSANEALVAAIAADDAQRVQEVLGVIKGLERRRNRLVHVRHGSVAAPVTDAGYQSSIPLRDQVIQALQLTKRPTPARLLADIVKARWSEHVESPSLSSLRRDEARSWRYAQDENRRTAVRDVYVVPALSYDRFTPVRGTLALSSWPTSRRLIAPLSPRVDMLHSTIALAEESARVAGTKYEDPMRRLVARLGASIPGVRPFKAELSEVIAAAYAELAEIEETDEGEREEAAERAIEQLEPEARLFGTALRAVVGGTGEVAG